MRRCVSSTTKLLNTDPWALPEDPQKKALWPLLSKRLARELDNLQACNDDYYRRYGDILRANNYKPATPWLEEGLFSGPEEASDVTKFSILSSRAVGANRVDVQLRFTRVYTYRVERARYEGVATVILEDNRWVIDDFVPMYENDDLHRLSDGYPECKGAQWVGEPPY